MTHIALHFITPANAALLDRVDEDVFDDAIQPAWLAQFLATPNHLLVVAVAVAEGEVIGMASGFTHSHPDKPLQLFINEVGVAGRFQRQGIGRSLVDAMLAKGRELGCHEAWTLTEAGNTPARLLYAATGGQEAREAAVVFAYPLGEADS